MAVKFYIPGPLRTWSDGRDEVEVPGAPATLGEALDALFAIHPGLRDRVLTETREVRRHVNLFIGPERCKDLGASLGGAVDLAILPAVSGGVH
jgi:sulfur-carrier protein